MDKYAIFLDRSLDHEYRPDELHTRGEPCPPELDLKKSLKKSLQKNPSEESIILRGNLRALEGRISNIGAKTRVETLEPPSTGSSCDYPWRSAHAFSSSRSPSASDSGDTEMPNKFLPPIYRRKQWVVETKNMKVEGRTVLLDNLPRLSTKIQAQVYDLLRGLGLADQIIVEASGNGTIFVKFSHPHVANAAYAILLARGCVLWNTEDSDDNEPVEISIGDEGSKSSEVEAVVVQCNSPSALTIGTKLSGILEEEDLYRNLAKDIYDDDTENSSGSDIDSSPSAKPSPLLPVVEENVNYYFNSSQEELGVHLSKAFEPPYSGTVANDYPLNDVGAIKPRSCASRAHRAPKNSENDQPIHTFHFNHVPIPKSPHNRARRVLIPKNDRPFITVSMRADIQLFHRQKPHHRLSKYSKPNYSTYRHTVDAAICGETTIIAYDHGPYQVSLLRFSSEDHSLSLNDLQLKPHQVSLDARNSKSTGAISCLAAKPMTNDHFKFFTGGHDRSLYIWNVKASNSITTERLTTLTTIPEALAFRHGSLLIGTSRKLMQVDLKHLMSTPKCTQLSNSIHQIHIDEQAPNIALLEVNSLDFQVQMYDERIEHGFDRTADCYFGARQASTPAQANRGDVKSSMFVKGYQDGTVCMWDFRNTKIPVLTHQFKDMGPIVHTVFAAGGIACYQENSLTFVDLYGGDSLIVDK